VFDSIATDEYRDNFRADRTPDMVDAKGSAYFFGVVQRARGVAIGDHIDMRGREDLQRSFQSSSNDRARLVAWDEESSVCGGRGYMTLSVIIWSWRFGFESHQEWCEGKPIKEAHISIWAVGYWKYQ
jgi:hypothetical protein